MELWEGDQWAGVWRSWGRAAEPGSGRDSGFSQVCRSRPGKLILEGGRAPFQRRARGGARQGILE